VVNARNVSASVATQVVAVRMNRLRVRVQHIRTNPLSTINESQEWVTAVEATHLTGTTRQHIVKLAELGYVTVRTWPGARPIYRRSDLERLASRITIEARPEAVAALQRTG
jgi:hypothetical protein